MRKDTVGDELDLLSTALSGGAHSTDALEALSARFGGIIGSLAGRYATDGESREELIAEGNMALSEAFDTFDRNRGVRLGTFIYQRVNSRMLHWWRSQNRALSLFSQESARRPRSLDEKLDAGDDGTSSLHEVIAADQDSPSDQAHVGLIRGVVMRAVARLANRQREAVWLRFWNELSPSEIADRLGVSRPRATVLIQNGLAHLRSELAYLN